MNKMDDEFDEFYVAMHDSCYDATGESKTEEESLEMLKDIPEEIKSSAAQWGWNDTEVRDKLYSYFKGQYAK